MAKNAFIRSNTATILIDTMQKPYNIDTVNLINRSDPLAVRGIDGRRHRLSGKVPREFELLAYVGVTTESELEETREKYYTNFDSVYVAIRTNLLKEFSPLFLSEISCRFMRGTFTSGSSGLSYPRVAIISGRLEQVAV